MNLTKDLLRRIRTKIQEELSKVEEELNITLTLGIAVIQVIEQSFNLSYLLRMANLKNKKI